MIPLTAEIAHYDEWTPDTVRERGEYLGKIADDIWKLD